MKCAVQVGTGSATGGIESNKFTTLEKFDNSLIVHNYLTKMIYAVVMYYAYIRVVCRAVSTRELMKPKSRILLDISGVMSPI